MRLTALLSGVEIKRVTGKKGQDPGNTDITGLASDSRQVKRGDLFVALRGERFDGNGFIGEALGKGAVAVVTDEAPPGFGDDGVVLIEVEDTRAALAGLAANFHGNPSRSLAVTGITGTNGKTTTSYLIHSALRHRGLKTGLIGTICHMSGDEVTPALHTTPQPLEFQGMLAHMLASGVTHVVAEVSSHALAQRRVDATAFRTAVFTNLTRDHLDFHKTMENYFEAKKRLFEKHLEAEGAAVINTDDPWGARLAGDLREDSRRVVSYGLDSGADIRAEGIGLGAGGLEFSLVFGGEKIQISSPLSGMHNVYNIMAAFGALADLGLSPEEAAHGIASLNSVKGRFEKIECGQDFLVIVDYAHTPDALGRLIGAARQVTPGRVITVFGCGGDRDRGKRPQMGQIASSLSDFVVVTSDNPRSEEPMKIITEIMSGAGGENKNKNCAVNPDRAEAIKMAVDMARPKDIVLIAGKGHEDYQEAAGSRRPFSDRFAATEAIRRRIAQP